MNRRPTVDYVITVCDSARESCPIFFGKTNRLHRSFEDPPPPVVGSERETMAIFRRVRHELRQYLILPSRNGKKG
jgi:arsenate reductase